MVNFVIFGATEKPFRAKKIRISLGKSENIFDPPCALYYTTTAEYQVFNVAVSNAEINR